MMKKVKEGYKAYDSTGTRPLSKKPKSRAEAAKQVTAVMISEGRIKGKGGKPLKPRKGK